MTPTLVKYMVPSKLFGLFQVQKTVEVYLAADVEAELKEIRDVIEQLSGHTDCEDCKARAQAAAGKEEG
jgi:hypothetical protein